MRKPARGQINIGTMICFTSFSIGYIHMCIMTAEAATTEHLLSRGGTCFTIAVMLKSNHLSPGDLAALSPQYRRGAEDIYAALGRPCHPADITAAIRASMQPEPATALPGYTAHFSSEENLQAVGEAIPVPDPLVSRLKPVESSQKGVCVIASAFCRSMDQRQSIAGIIPDRHLELLEDAGAMASIFIAPGLPSRLKRTLRDFPFQKDGQAWVE